MKYDLKLLQELTSEFSLSLREDFGLGPLSRAGAVETLGTHADGLDAMCFCLSLFFLLFSNHF
jgi:hypothetical protein